MANADIIPVVDDLALTVKVCATGYRIMRGTGEAKPFVFVRNGELLNLVNLLVDAHENREKKEEKK